MKSQMLAITGGMLVFASALSSQTTPQSQVAKQNQEEAQIRNVEAKLLQAGTNIMRKRGLIFVQTMWMW